MPKWIKCIWSHEIKFGTIDPFPLFQKVTSSYEPSLIIIDQFKKEQKITRQAVKQIESLIKMDKAMQVSYLAQDKDRYVSADKDKTQRYQQWLTNVGKDVYVDQAVKVINDMVSQKNLAKTKQNNAVKTF